MVNFHYQLTLLFLSIIIKSRVIFCRKTIQKYYGSLIFSPPKIGECCAMENTAEDIVETFKIHASVPENWRDVSVWAWDYKSSRDASEVWPGIPLEPEGNGWFTGELPCWVNSMILCGNRGSVQSVKVSFRSKEIWVIVTGDLRCDVSYSMPDLISVYAKVPVFWRNPHLWAWNGGHDKNAFYAWPGGLMINDGDYFRLSAPAWIDHVIINGKDGGVKTVDIEVEKGRNVYINVNRQGDYSLSYEQMPAAPDEPEPDFEEGRQTVQDDFKAGKSSSVSGRKTAFKKAAVTAAALILSAAALGFALHSRHNRK